MKNIILSLSLLVAAPLAAQQIDRLGFSQIDISRPDSTTLTIGLKVSPDQCRLGRDRLLEVTPILYSNTTADTVACPPILLAGKNQYYYTLRNDRNANEHLYLAGSEQTGTYAATLPYRVWMNNATCELVVTTTGCCGVTKDQATVPVADLCFTPPAPLADYHYVAPVATDRKVFNLEGRAYINFPVNRTEIYPDYMNNPVELRKVIGTIDTVRHNPDAKVSHIKLTGYASPEGPYRNNVRLAEGRTEALKKYVMTQYQFPASLFETSSVPEDWGGLREAIRSSVLAQRQAMLDFIDSNTAIETRNDRFRALFPADYPWLLKNVYPSLRHTDYVITYEVRQYTDVEEIKQVMKTRPQNLSLNELYLVAQTYQPGTPAYNEVFDIAVRLFPEDAVANINAANACMSRGDLESAERFLAKAGEREEAHYARGILASKQGDYDSALRYFGRCQGTQAADAAARVREIMNHRGTVRFRPEVMKGEK